MGTRGAYGFYKDGETKATYNHWDSYPSGLGTDVAKFVEATPVDEMKKIFEQINMINSNTTPTEEQIKKSEKYFNDNVNLGVKTDWYALLRESQGDLFAYKEGLPYMIEGGAEFIQDSLFCEYAYIINLDEEVFEIYKGFQDESEQNRYYSETVEDKQYKNCRLYRTIPLDQVSPDAMIQLEEDLNKEAEQEEIS